ncbi:MAG: double-strand break repair helicase AddA [Rhizobiaceae bacterium]|nr:double-strand break repair helicase AddA [Rhizobiaceae bacterium]
MNKPRVIPPQTLAAQATASDPRNSAWVSANAGSGKTHVLSQRVIRLLLGNTDPARILCLTYTRAAAANMANRVFRELSAWTALPDEELADAIARLDGARPGAAKLGLARRLFSKALETPGGLKIQTIHAFCESVLHQFPLEANIAAHFELLDSKMEQALVEEARRDLISGAADGGNLELADAFATVLERGGEFGLDKLLGEIIQRRDGIRRFIDVSRFGPDETDRAFAPLFTEFGFLPAETAESIADSVWPLPGFSPPEFSDFVQAADAAGAAFVQNNILPDAIAGFQETDPVRRLGLLAKAFLKKDGQAYGERSFAKGLRQRIPDIIERCANAAEVLRTARDRLALYRMLEGTAAALTVADRLIGRYEYLKTSRGFLDFNDLITRTVRLLSRPDAGMWVQYKLDKGIDHILLDEAQDTSPDQWQVVKSIAREFFSGQSARDAARTIFAVGDEKQSIYSFQGAAPESFAESGREFARLVAGAKKPFEPVRLTLSFRSTKDVLHAVDRVFESPEARRGLADETIVHTALRDQEPGYVEVWESIGAEQVEEPEDWRRAIDHAAAPAVRLAEQVARTIAGWLNDREIIEGKGRQVRPGDVLVLVRKRDSFVHALSRSLKELGIPVAGADRLKLAGHIAVQDMLALGRFLLQAEDDLSLAALLKSPIFGLSEERLFDVAARRPRGMSLIHAMRRLAADEADVRAVVELLDRWSSEAAYKPPFEFYSNVLQRDEVRRRMIARLGHEAGDILDEFLSFCLAEERTGLPGLTAFITTLETAGPEIKREMDQTRNEVRVMTVHASKGLEAPVVFLVDSGSAPFSDQHLPRLMPFSPTGDMRHVQGFLWRSDSEVKNSVTERVRDDLKDRADDEYRRLLYVGMTRAEDRLIVCGYHGRRAPAPNVWHRLVMNALSNEASIERHPHPDGQGDIIRYRVTQTPGKPVAADDAAGEASEAEEIFSLPPLGPPEVLPRPLSPSGAAAIIEPAPEAAFDPRSPVLDGQADTSFAAARGSAMHRMLQALPAVPEADRSAAAGRFLSLFARDWPDSERQAAWRSVQTILNDPFYAPLFAEGSRAEVAVAGTLDIRGKQRFVSGKIDRLAVTQDAVQIVDFKTNRPPPLSLDQVPVAYVLQLSLYAQLLRPLYPGRVIRAALLYTEAPRLIPVPENALAAALARLTQA